MVNLFPYKDLVYRVIGASMTVHSELGYGLLEPVYQEALYMELKERGIDCEREKELRIYYKNRLMEKTYRMDLMIGDVIVELKSVSELTPAHRLQLCNYLRLTHKPLGLLVNVGEESLVGERWAYDEEANRCFLIDRNMRRVTS